jgi:hypothetical protein
MNFSSNSKPLSGLANLARMNAASNNAASSLSSFWVVIGLVVAFFVVIVIYYRTIGYYLEVGWKRIYDLIRGREAVSVEIGGEGGLNGALKPMEDPSITGKTSMPDASDRPAGMPGATDADGLAALSGALKGTGRKEVFNVSRNIYKYSDAHAVCAALGAELATYDQVKEAYEGGADWCNYGWSKGQMALYPTQQSTYEKLQKGSPEYRSACGKVGVNGGYFDNPDLAFGVNCFGIKPPKSAMDELLESQVALPPSPAEIEFEKKVQKFRDQISTMNVLPFHKGQWSA